MTCDHRAETLARRAAFRAQVEAETGIDEAMIGRLVRAFYARVRADPLLAPVFEAVVESWEPHLVRMTDFWSSIALMSGRYHGSPALKHAPLPIEARHFERWLALFGETARAECPPAAAERFVRLAERIGVSMRVALPAVRRQQACAR